MPVDTSPDVAVDGMRTVRHRRGAMLPILEEIVTRRLKEVLRINRFAFAEILKENHGNVYSVLTGKKPLPLSRIPSWAKALNLEPGTPEYSEFVAAAHWARLKSKKLLAPSVQFLENFMRDLDSRLRNSERMRSGLSSEARDIAGENVELSAKLLALQTEFDEFKRKHTRT